MFFSKINKKIHTCLMCLFVPTHIHTLAPHIIKMLLGTQIIYLLLYLYTHTYIYIF